MTDAQAAEIASLSPIESTKKFYNEHVNDYIANINKAGVSHAPTEHAKTFVNYIEEFFPVSPEQQHPYKVLELGCGYGRDAELFVETGKINMIATDYSRSMLAKAQQRLEEHQNATTFGSVHCLEMDMRHVAQHFLPNSLHGIWACATIIHLPKRDVPALLQSIFEILKPGGVVYVSVKIKSSSSNFNEDETFDPDVRYGGIRKFYAFYEEEEFLQYFKQQNFILVDSGVSDHRSKDDYATHPFLHVFARKPSIVL